MASDPSVSPADTPDWTPEAALAFIEARPGDKDADAIIRSLAGSLLAEREHHTNSADLHTCGDSQSAADTIRAGIRSDHSEEFYRVHRPESCPKCKAHAALAVLLAVGERDKAEIERLTKSGCAFGCGPEGEEYVRPGVGIVPACPVHGWMCDWAETVRERDGRQIARLTEALAGVNVIAAAILSHEGHLDTEVCLEEVLPNAAAIQTLCARAAVLAGEEDAE